MELCFLLMIELLQFYDKSFYEKIELEYSQGYLFTYLLIKLLVRYYPSVDQCSVHNSEFVLVGSKGL
jgi:hypothetical protein